MFLYVEFEVAQGKFPETLSLWLRLYSASAEVYGHHGFLVAKDVSEEAWGNIT